MVQYGAPKDPRNQRSQQKTAGYGQDPSKEEPTVKKQDPSPSTDVVEAFHTNAAVGTRPEDIHHRIGIGDNDAASGGHDHKGGNSKLLFDGVVVTGSRGGNTALFSLLTALAPWGLKDSTTP